MNYYPLLDIQQALREAAHNLLDAITYVEALQAESGGRYPPSAAEALSALYGLRAALTLALPVALVDAIVAEQLLYELEHERWEG